jgi:deoxyribodipyrimidine photo-lyase
MIQAERIQKLNDREVRKGQFLLYWMQASQRAEGNHALEFAVREANQQNLPVAVVFVLTDKFPEANLRHYTFMLQGLQELQAGLEKRGILFVVRKGDPPEEVVKMSQKASLVVADRGVLRIQEKWRQAAAERAPVSVVQVESDVIVPGQTVSTKEEYAAATIRPKIKRLLSRFLVPLAATPVKRKPGKLSLPGLDLKGSLSRILSSFAVDRSVPPVDAFRGGTSEARRRLRAFLEKKLEKYPDLRNDPSLDYSSHMSPYLHFGQISPLEIALKVKAASKISARAREAYLEELIVRRELGMNFVRYNRHYDSYEAIPDWAKKTLEDHRRDKREFLYSPEEWEQARTHDPYWNAAQMEMVLTGKMHNYMRMYWGKKILEWSKSPEEAFRIALYLNNKYELDGRDPNGFAGVAWCFGKHDRPWPEREVFGKVRYMNAAGLRRKFRIEDYVRKVEDLKR